MTATQRIAARPGRLVAGVAIGLDLAFAAGLWAIRFFGEKAPVRSAEWWIGDVALASVFALPAIVGIIALRGRERLLRSAAILCFVLSVALLVSLVTLPLVIPGALFLIAATRTADGAGARGRTGPVAVVTTLAALGALAGLVFAPSDVVCWHETRYADGRIVTTRDHVAELASSSGSHSMTSGPPSAGVISESGGCTDGAFAPSRSLLAIASVAAATFAVWRFG